MRLLLLSDCHVRSSVPAGRIDNFMENQWKKWQYICKVAKKENVDAILQAGDLFDIPNPSYSLISEFLFVLLEDISFPIYYINGQHTLFMRNKNINKTIFGILQYLIIDTGYPQELFHQMFSYGDCIGDNVYLYGNNYGDGYKDIKVRNKDAINILVTHDSIGNKSLYPGHNITKAENFLATFKDFQIILCGDIHYPFFIQQKGRVILNTGCLLRQKRIAEDMNRKPHFYTYNTETNKWKKYYVPILPVEQTFDLISKKEESSEQGAIMIEFVEKLKQKEGVGIEYLKNLKLFMEENEVSKETKELIWEVLADVAIKK